MQKNIIWSGIKNTQTENCIVQMNDNLGVKAKGTITGVDAGFIFKIDYSIKLGGNWQTLGFEIKAQLANTINYIKFDSDGNGNWTVNNKALPEFAGCIDIDIALTPFTNSLPVNRLNMQPGQQQLIKVLYIDVVKQELLPVEQMYTCINATTYKYQNTTDDFEAIIHVDENGLVEIYESLFTQVMKQESSYVL